MNPALSYRLLTLVLLGGAVGGFAALGMYVAKPSYVLLVPFGLALLVPAFCLKNARTYWFVLFLLSLQFQVSKNLNDGLAVIQALKIDYTIWYFTFEITATDLVLLVLLVIWANDRLFHGRTLRFPRVTWLAAAYLGICLLSTLTAASPYLGFVELSRQMKFFIVYLYAVNCLDTKETARTLVLVGVLILVTQAGMTVTRSLTGYVTPITFGETYQNQSQIEQYLSVDRFDDASSVRGFGTLGSPGSTLRLCMMVIPFALFLCVPNTMVRMRVAFMALTAFGLLGLLLTFTRVYYITTAFQLGLSFVIMLRDGLVTRKEAAVVVVVGMAALAAVSPKLYDQFTVREDSVSVRFMQYEATGRMIVDNPLIGVGLNNGTAQKPRYVSVTYNKYDSNTQFYLEPTHNLYLSMASEIGIPGTILFLAFFTRIAMEAWRHSRFSPDPDVRFLGKGLFVVFCSVAVNGLMDPLAEYPVLILLWLYAGVTLNLRRMAQPSADPARRLATGAAARY